MNLAARLRKTLWAPAALTSALLGLFYTGSATSQEVLQGRVAGAVAGGEVLGAGGVAPPCHG